MVQRGTLNLKKLRTTGIEHTSAACQEGNLFVSSCKCIYQLTFLSITIQVDIEAGGTKISYLEGQVHESKHNQQ